MDKSECSETCPKLRAFRTPTQISINHKEQAVSKLEALFEPQTIKKPKSIPRGTRCSLCKKAATRMGFKSLYGKPLCESCRRKLARRLERTGSIRDPKTGGV
jgi:hypothetical protein